METETQRRIREENARLVEEEERIFRERRARVGILPAPVAIPTETLSYAERQAALRRADEERVAEAENIRAELIAKNKAKQEKAVDDQKAIADRVKADAIAKEERQRELERRRPELEAEERAKNLNLSRTQTVCPVCRTTVHLVDGKLPRQHSYKLRDMQSFAMEERICHPYGLEQGVVVGHPMLRSI